MYFSAPPRRPLLLGLLLSTHVAADDLCHDGQVLGDAARTVCGDIKQNSTENRYDLELQGGANV
ncbi:hypothetical protein D3C76_279710 [compost metagenome]